MRDAVGRLDGVQHVEVEFGTQRVYVTPARDQTLDLAALAPAVRAGGGRVVRTRIVATGCVERGGDGARFRIDGWPDAYPIEADLADGPSTIRAGVRFEAGAPRLHVVED